MEQFHDLSEIVLLEMRVPDHIIRGLRKGQRAEQEAAYRLLYSDAYKIAMRYAHSTPVAQDVLNKAFFKALTKIDSFKGDGANFFGWLKRIIINQALDEIKTSSFSQSFAPIEEASDQGIDMIGEKDDYDNVIALIQQLADTSKCVFNLYAIDGYSHREIAQRLGITEDNSRYHLHAARKQLKAWIFKTEQL
ncbi:MAG: RNA polymerase sigma factor [Saprospiraceae bacterium]|nr:RNA polymerase sigma factor [Saprospiraceae bacterium]